ncbi:hypothetical protein BG003_005208 [Podila horticola]|nr:hypothetical protein BG003_005208 [Podila horticola]
MSDSDETTSVTSDTNDRFYDPESEHTYDSAGASASSSSSSTTTIPSSAIAALTALNTLSNIPRSPFSTPRTSTTAPLSSSQITIALHFRLGVPLQRSRSRKHIPPPIHIPLPFNPPPSFDAFMGLLRTQTDAVPRCHWPTGSRAYLQPAHSSSQWQYLELTPVTFVEKLEKAWRNESKRCMLSIKDEKAAAHVYVYMVEEEDEGSSPVVERPSLTKAESGVEEEGGGGEDHEDGESKEETRVREREQDLDVERVHQPQGLKRRVEEVYNGEGSSSSISSFSSLARTGSGSGSGSGSFLSFSSRPGIHSGTSNITTTRSPAPAHPTPLRQRFQVEEDKGDDEEEEEEEFRTIRLRVNGTVVNYEIELRSLREALGLALLGDGASSKRRRT